MPVCCSMTAWACLAERGGCSRKYSSREASCSARALVGLMPLTLTEARQAALEILVEVALDGAPGDVGVGGDLVVGQAVALEPEDLHLALDAGVGVVVAVVGQGFPVVLGEGDRAHDGPPRCWVFSRSPSGVYPHARSPTICVRPGRAEYISLGEGVGEQPSETQDEPSSMAVRVHGGLWWLHRG